MTNIPQTASTIRSLLLQFLVALCLVALAGCGGTLRRIAGDERHLPRAEEIWVMPQGPAVAGQRVTFKSNIAERARDKGVGTPLQYLWTFGGGTLEPSSTLAEPQVTLRHGHVAGANYQGAVTVTALHPSRPPAETYGFTYTVTAAGMQPLLILSVQPEQATIGQRTRFSAVVVDAEGVPVPPAELSYRWDLGTEVEPGSAEEEEEGPTFTGSNPEVIFTGSAGQRTLSLTVAFAGDTTSATTFPFVVELIGAMPQVLSLGELPARDLYAGSTASFAVTPSGYDLSELDFEWDFGGGVITTEADQPAPSVSVPAEKVRGEPYIGTVTATVRTDPSVFATQTFQYSIKPATSELLLAIADATYTENTQATFVVTPVGRDISELTFAWDFGGGAELTVPAEGETAHPIVTVTIGAARQEPYVGSVVAKLIADPNVVSTLTFKFTVETRKLIEPIADATYTAGTEITFTAIPVGHDLGDIDFEWDFGGGATPDTSAAERPKVVVGPTRVTPYIGTVTATLRSDPDFSTTRFFKFTVVAPPAP